MTMTDSFKAKATLKIGSKTYNYLLQPQGPGAQVQAGAAAYSYKILLENCCGSKTASASPRPTSKRLPART